MYTNKTVTIDDLVKHMNDEEQVQYVLGSLNFIAYIVSRSRSTELSEILNIGFRPLWHLRHPMSEGHLIYHSECATKLHLLETLMPYIQERVLFTSHDIKTIVRNINTHLLHNWQNVPFYKH